MIYLLNEGLGYKLNDISIHNNDAYLGNSDATTNDEINSPTWLSTVYVFCYKTPSQK